MTDEHIVCLICNEDLEDKSSEATAKMIKNDIKSIGFPFAEYPVSSHLNLISAVKYLPNSTDIPEVNMCSSKY